MRRIGAIALLLAAAVVLAVGQQFDVTYSHSTLNSASTLYEDGSLFNLTGSGGGDTFIGADTVGEIFYPPYGTAVSFTAGGGGVTAYGFDEDEEE